MFGQIVVTVSIIGLLIIIPISHYWVFIKDPKEIEKDEEQCRKDLK